MTESASFDVFISYSSRDRASVLRLVEKLKRRRLRVWIDEDQMRPGEPVIGMIEKGLEASKTIAVVIGKDGFGRYHQAESEVAVQTQIEKKRSVIPVFLPDIPDEVEEKLPAFLRRSSYVRFRGGLDDADAFAKLLWGITGQKVNTSGQKGDKGVRPPEPPEVPGSETERLADAAAEIVGAIRRSGNVTFFLGARSAPYEADTISRPCRITRELLGELELIDERYDQLLPSVDTAGTYYAMKRGPRSLEDCVARLTDDQAEAQPVVIPPLYEKLAITVRRLQRASATGKRKRFGSEPELIVSTSLDLMCERALLRAGVPFTRFVQHRSGELITVNEYAGVTLDGDRVLISERNGDGGKNHEVAVPRDDMKALDEAISMTGYQRIKTAAETSVAGHVHPLKDLALSDFTEPYVYKYHGSRDVPQSCALSTDHYLRLATRPFVPDRIIEIMSNSAAVFLGCGLLDADVLHTYGTLLQRAFRIGTEAPPRYVVLRPPAAESKDTYRRMETGIWPKVKETALQQMGMTILEGQSSAFLDLLLTRLENERWGTA